MKYLQLSSRLLENGINILNILGYHSSRFVEYQFAYKNITSLDCNILDVGSCGSLFALKMAKQGHHVYSVDTRRYHEVHKNLKTFQNDIKNQDFNEDFFDVITCISTIEHIGLSAYGDPMYDNGDTLMMKKFKKILKKNGKLIITLPFSGINKLNQWKQSFERIYNWQQLDNLFNEWNIVIEEYYIPHKSQRNWVLSDRRHAEQVYSEYPISNLACFILNRCDKE